MRKKIFHVEYKGLWMGGVAIVKATNAEEAIAKVESLNPPNFENVRVTEVKEDILYHDTGDY